MFQVNGISDEDRFYPDPDCCTAARLRLWIDPGDGGEIIQIKPYYIYNLHVCIDNIYLLSEVDV